MRAIIGHFPDGKGNRKRTVRVRVDAHDVYAADTSLALIIHPVLVKVRAAKAGSPAVDDEDVPEELRSTSAPPLPEEDRGKGLVDAFFHKRWEWVMDEMIFAFHQLAHEGEDDVFWQDYDDVPEDAPGTEWFARKYGKQLNKERAQAREERIRNGTRLFGLYFQSLWT